MRYDEYFEHEFDESKVRRDKNGRFAKKSSNGNLVTGPSDDTKDHISISGQIAKTRRVKKDIAKNEREARIQKLKEEKLKEISSYPIVSTFPELTPKPTYVQKVKRILHRLFKREISLNSAVTVIKKTTKDRVNEFMNRKLGTFDKEYLK